LNLARTFSALGALGVVCDPSQAALAVVRQRHPHVKTTASYADVLGDPGVSSVAIAAPAARHFELAEAALRAGKHVFVEKPLCLRLDDAALLVQLANSLGKTLMVGHLLQYHAGIAKLQELVRAGELGELLTISSSRLNLGRFRKEEDALWSFAPHDISVILSLLGDRLPESLRCMGTASLSRELVDSTLTVMRFAGGATAQIYVSWLNPFKEQKLTIVGSRGMAVFDDTKPWPEKLTLYRDYLGWTQAQEPVPLQVAGEHVAVAEAEPLLTECQHFLRACAGGEPSRTDGNEGMRVLQVLELAQRSLELGGEAVTPASQRAFFAHPTAVVDPQANIGAGTKLWHFAHVMAGARIGERCSFGQNTHVAGGAIVGNGVKVQNNVSIYAGVVVVDAVFLGPSCVLTNITNPRAELERRSLYERTRLKRGASVGANATLAPGITLGCYSFIAAGAVVTRDVPDYALMVGNPARQQGWMSRHGHRLQRGPDELWVCPESGLRYREQEPGVLRCLDLDEQAALPASLAKSEKSYDELKG
jgi:UDP-2-acetamido-3-amino-2,3-dideoxy-glucuronate N-acetyltransferase